MWAGIRNYIIMVRPSMSFLENATELMNECEVPKPKGADEWHGSDDENVKILTSNDKLIKQQLEEEGFTVILCVDPASDGGSRVERARCYPVVLDIPRDIADELAVEGNFVRVMRQRRIPQFPFEMFMLSDRHLVELDEAMEGEPGPSAAKNSKEELYTLCGLEWPLDLANSSFQVCARGSRRCPSWPTRPFLRMGALGIPGCKPFC